MGLYKGSVSHLVCMLDITFLLSLCPKVAALEAIHFPIKNVILWPISILKLQWACVGYCINEGMNAEHTVFYAMARTGLVRVLR